jgi:hypothetical protein
MGKTDRESNISSILYRTADVITSHGWNRGGGWWNGEITRGRLCVEGALQKVLNMPHDRCGGATSRNDFTSHPAYRFLQGYVGTTAPLHAWNDDHWHTEREVVTILRRAAAQAQELERETELAKKKESMKYRKKLSIKAIAFWMNTEMDEFEESIQTTTLTDEKELIDA